MFSRQEDAAGPCAWEKHTQVLGEVRAPCSPTLAKSMDPLHGHKNSFKCNAIFKDCFLGNRKWRRRMITQQKSLTFHLNNSVCPAFHSPERLSEPLPPLARAHPPSSLPTSSLCPPPPGSAFGPYNCLQRRARWFFKGFPLSILS